MFFETQCIELRAKIHWCYFVLGHSFQKFSIS